MLAGFDFIHLDGEHGLFSPESIDEMCRVADGFGLTVTARVPDIRASTINQFLDRGVMGVMGPHVETAEEAQALVDACRYVPDGQRSWGRRARHVLQQHPAARRPPAASAPSSCAGPTQTCS